MHFYIEPPLGLRQRFQLKFSLSLVKTFTFTVGTEWEKQTKLLSQLGLNLKNLLKLLLSHLGLNEKNKTIIFFTFGTELETFVKLHTFIFTVGAEWDKFSNRRLSDQHSLHNQVLCLNPIQGGGGLNQPPLSRICVYARVYTYTRANFFWQFLIFSVEEGTALSTQ